MQHLLGLMMRLEMIQLPADGIIASMGNQCNSVACRSLHTNQNPQAEYRRNASIMKLSANAAVSQYILVLIVMGSTKPYKLHEP
jgi:hypothetical protein